MSTLRILVEHGQSDPMIGDRSFPSCLQAWLGSYAGYLWLIRQEYFVIEVDGAVNSTFIDLSHFSLPRACNPMLLMPIALRPKNKPQIIGSIEKPRWNLFSKALEVIFETELGPSHRAPKGYVPSVWK